MASGGVPDDVGGSSANLAKGLAVLEFSVPISTWEKSTTQKITKTYKYDLTIAQMFLSQNVEDCTGRNFFGTKVIAQTRQTPH